MGDEYPSCEGRPSGEFGKNKSTALMKILKLCIFWALTIGTSAMLLSGFVHAYDPDDRIDPSTPQILPKDSAAGSTVSAARQGAAGALKRGRSKAESTVSKQPQLGPNFGFGPKGLAFETADANPYLRMGPVCSSALPPCKEIRRA